jgi:hypothetical protein
MGIEKEACFKIENLSTISKALQDKRKRERKDADYPVFSMIKEDAETMP